MKSKFEMKSKVNKCKVKIKDKIELVLHVERDERENNEHMTDDRLFRTELISDRVITNDHLVKVVDRSILTMLDRKSVV